MSEEIRCRSCGKLLAKRLPDDSYEIRRGSRFLVSVREGSVLCLDCELMYELRRPGKEGG